jgi:ribosomal protein L7/L12
MTNKYHLTLTDPESKMTLRHEKPGYIEVGINEGEVEFSMPVAFLQAFVTSVGGSIHIPDTLQGQPENGAHATVVLDRWIIREGQNRKIAYIKSLRKHYSSRCHMNIGLREAKNLVERALEEPTPVFTGPRDQAKLLASGLRTDGFAVSLLTGKP